MEEETTNQILTGLQGDICLEISDCRGQGDRVAAAILQRVANALERNITRRAAAEQAAEEPLTELNEAQVEAATRFGEED